MKPLFSVIFVLFALSTAACGFTPLYATGPGRAAIPFDAIAIPPIPDRSGVVLRNALIDRFYTHGAPQNPTYTLTIAPITESRQGLDITIDEEVTRTQLRLATTLTLVDNATHQTLLTRPLYSLVSYNVLESQFTTRVSGNNARDHGLNDLARQVEQALALYFRGQHP